VKKAGQLITDADILIAGLSYIKNMILVTNDSDFGRIEDISVENWLNDN
jgi:predicted nucleic acid-binding protein